LGEVLSFDFFGKREEKYQFLNMSSHTSINWNELDKKEPNYFLVKKDFIIQKDYTKNFNVNDLFALNASGITTERDHLTIQFEEKDLNEIKSALFTLNEDAFRQKYTPKPDGRDWKISFAKNDFATNNPVITSFPLYLYTEPSSPTNP
jgi:hypothetical protein